MAKKTTFKTIFGEPQAPKKRKQTEGQLQTAVCKYLKLQYPDVMFTSDLSSGTKLPIYAAVRNKALRSDRGLPDLLILKKKIDDKGLLHVGLAIELKAEGSSPFLKDGVTLSSNEHIREQAAILERLRQQGWMACFGCGFTQIKLIIDNYLK